MNANVDTLANDLHIAEKTIEKKQIIPDKYANNPNFHFDIDQRSPEWFELKRGVISASKAAPLFINPYLKSGKLAAGAIELPFSKKENIGLSKGLVSLCDSIAAQRLTTEDDPGYSSIFMQTGNDREPFAKVFFEEKYDCEVIECGFIRHNIARKQVGFSPDGLIFEENAVLELKCPSAEKHLSYLNNVGQLKSDYLEQCLYQLYIAKDYGFDKVVLASYHPYFKKEEMKMITVEITMHDFPDLELFEKRLVTSLEYISSNVTKFYE